MGVNMTANNIKAKFLTMVSVILILSLNLAVATAREKTTNTKLPNEGRVRFVEYLPENYDASKEYPVILAFGGGPQTVEAARGIFREFIETEAEKRGYIVIAPVAKRSKLFFRDGDRIFPEFLDYIMNNYNVLDGKLHLMGYSNGGISAFHIAVNHPTYFKSISTWPGYLPSFSNDKIANLAGMCITTYWGSRDDGWNIEILSDSQELDELGIPYQVVVLENETHRMDGLRNQANGMIFDRIENCEN